MNNKHLYTHPLDLSTSNIFPSCYLFFLQNCILLLPHALLYKLKKTYCYITIIIFLSKAVLSLATCQIFSLICATKFSIDLKSSHTIFSSQSYTYKIHFPTQFSVHSLTHINSFIFHIIDSVSLIYLCPHTSVSIPTTRELRLFRTAAVVS